MKPSAETIYKALLRGEKLTPLVSWTRYGVHSLSQRIGEIRIETGLDVVSRRVKGDSFHEYCLRGDDGHQKAEKSY